LKRQNDERLKVLEAENQRLWDIVELEAKERADAAREATK